MTTGTSPAARALLALEAIQASPGITARCLGDRLGVTERAARRYVAILREAGLPVESVTGPYGGYRAGRGLRLPPLMFTAAEAMGLAMAVLEGHRKAADPGDLVGGALAKILRALPERVAGPVREVRARAEPLSPPAGGEGAAVSPELLTRLIEWCSAGRRVRLCYRAGSSRAGSPASPASPGPQERELEVDPWAVVLRHGRWYLLCWSHARQARRLLRADRITAAAALPATFTPPPGLDALRVLEEHLSQGWEYEVDVIVDAPAAVARRWLPRCMAMTEPHGDGRARLRGSTSDPDWYVRRLAAIEAPFRILGGPEIRAAAAALGRQLLAACAAPGDG
jgi:predicted DNA-binding transcriptional regulator YafY